VTFESPDTPFVRRHRATGQPKGARPGNRNRWVHGKRSRDAVERRKATMQFLRQCHEAVEKAQRPGLNASGRSGSQASLSDTAHPSDG
jgi:hypothetical protein